MIRRDLYQHFLDESSLRRGFGALALLRAYRRRVAQMRLTGGAR